MRATTKRWICLGVLASVVLASACVLVVGAVSARNARRRAEARVAALVQAISSEQAATGTTPALDDHAQLRRSVMARLPAAEADFALGAGAVSDPIRDSWGTPFRFVIGAGGTVVVACAGPDRAFGTQDDISIR